MIINRGRRACAWLLCGFLTSTPAFSQSVPDRLVVQFAPGVLAPPLGRTAGSIEDFEFSDPELRNALMSKGVVYLARLFPTFRSEDCISTNLIGEPVLLDDLSDYFFLSIRSGSSLEIDLSLRSVPGIRHAGWPQLRELTSFMPNDPLFQQGKQWGLYNTAQTLCSPPAPPLVADTDINAPEAWSITTGDSSVRVGILDTGIHARPCPASC